eukprot:5385936-Pyramimonas_sp.AAC.1
MTPGTAAARRATGPTPGGAPRRKATSATLQGGLGGRITESGRKPSDVGMTIPTFSYGGDQKSFFMKFEDLPDTVLSSAGWLDAVLGRMDLMIGEREGDELRRSGRKALYE